MRVLLIRRAATPCKGDLALPGGFVRPSETVEDAAWRTLQGKTSVKPAHLEQLCTFSALKRDPRGWVITVAHLGLVRVDWSNPKAGLNAGEVVWTGVHELPERMAFDHAEIVRVALERLIAKVQYAPIGLNLLPEKFTISELRRLYEVLLQRDGAIDISNFRKRLLATGLLVEVGVRRGTGRPAPLYRFDRNRYEGLIKTGFNPV